MSGSLLATAAAPSFARHETFHPRFGWLRKAVTESAKAGDVFVDDEATVKLGVGKNMVNAIRYWGLAFKILEQKANPERPRVPLTVPSAFGMRLLSDDGWDPYLEDAASLWLLHWKLLSPKCYAPVWWVAFNDFTAIQFNESQLTAHVLELAAAAGWPTVVEASVKKDVDCLIRTYTVRRHGRQSLDDILDCPFRELGLIEAATGEEGRRWRFVVGEKPGLPDEIVAHAALDYAALSSDGARSISIARLAHDPGSPGAAFRLNETALFNALSRAAISSESLRVAEPGGLRQLLFDDDPAAIADRVLTGYYVRWAAKEVVGA
jgi:Protein of unknown function (DUF4007)